MDSHFATQIPVQLTLQLLHEWFNQGRVLLFKAMGFVTRMVN